MIVLVSARIVLLSCIIYVAAGWLSGIKMSRRIMKTESPYIEDVLERYCSIPDLTMLALGSVYWNPPEKSIAKILTEISDKQVHKYGSILGDEALRSHLSSILGLKGLDMSSMDLAITAGANQAFSNAALAVCDEGDHAVILAPYYFSHKLSLQLCGAQVHVCPFDPATLAPDWDALEAHVAKHKPKMIVLTSPNNPSGYVYPPSEVDRIVSLAASCGAWLVADQTYHEFLYDDAMHVIPGCSISSSSSSGIGISISTSSTRSTSSVNIAYDRIIHIFSFSKIFGMPGWRVGYVVFPKALTQHMRKLQDTIPTHAAILSQKLALSCLQEHYPLDLSTSISNRKSNSKAENVETEDCPVTAREGYSAWARGTIGTLEDVRAALWPVVQPFGTVYTKGAFYFLVPVPERVTEDEAVHILATKYCVLLMHGTPFGAPNHMRLSYGSIPPSAVLGAIDKIRRGFAHLQDLSDQRLVVV